MFTHYGQTENYLIELSLLLLKGSGQIWVIIPNVSPNNSETAKSSRGKKYCLQYQISKGLLNLVD